MFVLQANTDQALGRVFRASSTAMRDAGVTDYTLLSQPGDVVQFDTLLNSKAARESGNCFSVLNKYCKYRGDDFIEQLFKEYEVMSSITLNYLRANDSAADAIKTKFINQLDNITALLDIDAIYNFMMNVEGIHIPPGVNDTFNNNMLTDGTGTREQTYIRSDYEWLMPLIVVLKAIYGPVAELITGNPDHLKEHKELQMLDILKMQEIYQHHAFKKLRQYVYAVVDRAFEKEKVVDLRILSNRLSLDAIRENYLSRSLFGKIILMDQEEKDDRRNIVTYIFKEVNSNIKSGSGGDGNIRHKTRPSDSEERNDPEQESVIESYRIATEVPPGIQEEFNWATSTVDRILHQLPHLKDINESDVKQGMRLAATLAPGDISNLHISLMSAIFKPMIFPKALKYLRYTQILNLVAVAYATFKLYGIDPLAYVIVSKRELADGSQMDMFTNISATKAKGYREDELAKYYSMRERTNNGDEGPLDILRWINATYKEIFKYTWIIPSELNMGVKDMLVPTLRNLLVDYIIENERRITSV